MFISDIQRAGIRNTLGSVFRVREGEWSKLSLLWLTLFFSITANFLVWSVLQATFIKRLGVNLFPLLYLSSSIAILVGSVAYAKGVVVYKKTTVMHLFNAAAILFVFLSWVLLGEANKPSDGAQMYTYAYFFFGLLGNSAFLSFISSQLWTLINDVFSTSQGKRLFPLLGIAGTVGGMVAGALLEWLTPVIDPAGILLVAIAFMAATSPCLALFRRIYAKEIDWYLAYSQKKEEEGTGALRRVFRYVMGSKFIMALAAVVLLHWFFNRLFGFVFAEVSDRAFPTEEAFTQFSGLYLLAGCLGSILFDTLFLNRILERIGLTRGMFFVSNLVTGLDLAMFAFPIFPVVIGVYFVRDIILSIQNNSIQVMTGIIPDEHRPKVTSFLDGYVVTVGGGIGSLLTLALAYFVPRSPIELEIRVFAVLILLLLIIRFALNFYVRHEFFRILENNLVYGDLKTKSRAIETLVEHKYLKRSGIGKLIDTLKDVSEPLSIKEGVVRVLGQITDPTTMRVLIHQLTSEEPALRLAAARALGEFRLTNEQFYDVAFSRHHAIQQLRALFERDQDEVIRAAALDALIHLEDPDIVPFLLELLQRGDHDTRADCIHSLRLFHDPALVDDARRVLLDKDPLIRSHAIVALWQFPWEREKLKPIIRGMILAHSPREYVHLTTAQRHELRIGLKTAGDVRFMEMQPLLREGLDWDVAPVIQAECALSLFKMGVPEGQRLIRRVLDGDDLEAIKRIRLIASKHVMDGKAASILQEAIEQSALQYPNDAPSSERLDRPLGLIPVPCLHELEKIYLKTSEHQELAKIHHALELEQAPKEAHGTVLLIEPDSGLRRLYTIALLAHGYLIHDAGELPGGTRVPKEDIVVDDAGGTKLVELTTMPKELARKLVRIVGRQHLPNEKDVAEVEHAEGIVFRHHFAPSELVAQVGKRLHPHA